MVNIKSIIDKLQKHYPDATQVAVVDRSGKLLHSSGKWDVKRDIKGVLSNWASGNAQFVTLNDIRYSILQMEPERFIATNRKNKGHLIGASTPKGDILFIAHIKPKAKGWFHMAYPAVARAAAMLKKKSDSAFIDTKIDLSDVSETNVVETPIGNNSSNVFTSSTSALIPWSEVAMLPPIAAIDKGIVPKVGDTILASSISPLSHLGTVVGSIWIFSNLMSSISRWVSSTAAAACGDPLRRGPIPVIFFKISNDPDSFKPLSNNCFAIFR